MIFAISFFLNAATNFAFGLTLSAILGPAEFGRYSTVQLASITLAGGMLDWLRCSSLRFSGERPARASSSPRRWRPAISCWRSPSMPSSALCAPLGGVTFGLGAPLLLLTPLLGVAAHRVDFMGARFRARDEGAAVRRHLRAAADASASPRSSRSRWATRNAVMTVAALAAANLIPAIAVLAARPRRRHGAQRAPAPSG